MQASAKTVPNLICHTDRSEGSFSRAAMSFVPPTLILTKKGRPGGRPLATTPMRRFAPAETSNREYMDRARRTETDNMRHADLRIRDQPLLRATVLRQMPHDLADIRDTGRTQRMALRE